MAGGDSPNMRAKKDTKDAFDQLLTQVLAKLELPPRGLTADHLLQALVAVGKQHFDEVVAAAAPLASQRG